MLLRVLFAGILLALGAPSAHADLTKSCSTRDCPAGSKVKTVPKNKGQFMACRSEEITDYVNTVIGLVSMQAAFGIRGNIDPKTGEPEFQGQTKQMVDTIRSRAGVSSFDEAARSCRLGPYSERLEVMNFKKGRNSTWVYHPKTKQTFWVPSSVIDPL